MKKIEDLINKIGGHVGIYAENLDTGTKIEINSEDFFPAASVIKLPILAALHTKFSLGEYLPEKTIQFFAKDLVSDSLWFEKAKFSSGLASLSELANHMITISDNTATNLLIDLLGFTFINQEIQKKGLKKTIIRRKMCDFFAREQGLENITTPADMGIFFQELLRTNGSLIKYEDLFNYQKKQPFDPKNTSKEILKIMSEQKDLEKIPSGIDANLFLVANKPGELPGIRNDVALIISKENENFIICIFCEQVAKEEETDALIGDFTKNLILFLQDN